ncbi:MAG: rhamnulokinase [Candidatus Symbiothrix sp.]|jgi:rhamnulokinase|nr:rhamnulokinase [Candidatus Symbiothrix sp.]
MKTHHFLAFDMGATSGRSILGTLQEGRLALKELTRFPNKISRIHDNYYWDLFALYESIKEGLRAVQGAGYRVQGAGCTLDAIGIDTWGVDFVYIGEYGSVLSQPRSYRDPYTSGKPEEYFKLLPRKEVYDLTGIQIMDFNSLYQLFAAKGENSAALKVAKNILFMPDALSYLLTGKQICEYTIASTSQLLNPRTKQFEPKLLEVAGINPDILLPVVMPGTIIGNLTDALSKETGLPATPVIAVAGHDTASAVAAVPAENENFAYLSSGTWSLMGIEVKEPIITEESYALNFTNEGGVEGTTRFLKNITGLWLLEQCRKEWEAAGKPYGYAEIVALAESASGFSSRIDPDHPSFANPESMTQAITAYCRNTKQETPQTDAEFIRCIFESLALKYKEVLDNLQRFAPFKIEKLHVIGGGSQNKLLNQLTANAIGMPVIAGPSEATAYGNILMQAKGLGIVKDLQEMRTIIRRSVTLETFYPENN